MIKLNCGLYVWQKPKEHLLANYQFLMTRTQQRISGQTISKTVAKPARVVKNHEKRII